VSEVYGDLIGRFGLGCISPSDRTHYKPTSQSRK
jgi:hypothetical protein